MRGGRRRGFTAALAGPVLCGALLTGCSGSDQQLAGSGHPTPSGTPHHAVGTPAEQLAGLVAVAADRHYTATYRYVPKGRSARTITVTLATDGTWRVDVPGGGLGGGRDISVAATRAGVYQCGAADPASCEQVAGRGHSVPPRYDPRVERLFTRWLPTLGDRAAALSVADAPAPRGVPGRCFSVEPTAASLSSPVPSGVYCLAEDGTVTGARLGLGTVTLTGRPASAPGSVSLAGPVTAGAAVPTRSP
ncbi:MAG: hypothetical protein WCA46_07755, partial [Actinocatenispora sp.]